MISAIVTSLKTCGRRFPKMCISSEGDAGMVFSLFLSKRFVCYPPDTSHVLFIQIECQRPILGRHVAIGLHTHGSHNAATLVLQEVEVYDKGGQYECTFVNSLCPGTCMQVVKDLIWNDYLASIYCTFLYEMVRRQTPIISGYHCVR